MSTRCWVRGSGAVLGLACLSFAPARAQVVRNGGLALGTSPITNPIFPDDNWWNRNIRCAPVDSNSTNFINFIGSTTGLHPDFGGDDTDTGGDAIYGLPYITVSGTQPLELVTFVDFDDQSDHGAPGRPLGYPIPVEARAQPKWIEGGDAGGGTDGDHHMLIVDRDNHILYELYQAHWNVNHWEAASGAIFLLDRNNRRRDTWTSADASGMALLPGLVRYDEVFGSDPDIHHAFRATTDVVNGYVYPATHDATTSSSPNAVPLGARLRLKSTVNFSSRPAYIQKIFRAMQNYGLIVADNGSDGYVQGTYDTSWNNDELNPAFGALKLSDFEVIQRGWDAAKGDFSPICDGQVDILFDNLSTNAHVLWLMNGIAQASSVAVTPDVASADWKVVGTDDFDLDSHTDLVTWNQTTGAVEFWMMNGTARIGAAVPLTGAAPLALEWRLAATGDFNHDGHPDLMWRNTVTQKLTVWIMNGTAKASEVTPVPDQAVDNNWAVIAALDLDGDRFGDEDNDPSPNLDVDLLWYNATSGKIVRWLMDSSVHRISGQFTNPANAGDNNWKVVAAGDLGIGAGGVYGTKDIIWRNDTSGKLVAWYMNLAGSRTFGTFTTPDSPATPLSWNVVGPK